MSKTSLSITRALTRVKTITKQLENLLDIAVVKKLHYPRTMKTKQ